MARIVYDSNGNKLGSYEGSSDIGKVFDKDGNPAGEYWGGDIFDKNGMRICGHNGDPEKTVKILLER